MNYFGHAALCHLDRDESTSRHPEVEANRIDERAPFVLGAMLPDLCAMAGLRCARSRDERVNAGIDFHMETDAVFHETRMFIEHNRRVCASLRELGVGRGPARACAHIGVEMLIDAVLVESERHLGQYTSALRWGASQLSVLGSTEFGRGWSLPTKLRLKGMLAHLADRGASVFEPTFDRLSARFAGALAHRPRLAPNEAELSTIASFLAEDTRVRRDVPALLDEMSKLEPRIC